MPSAQRRPAPHLIGKLLASPQRFEFFQAVRVLRLYFRDVAGLTPDQIDARLRFRSSLSLSFPASEIESLEVQFRTAVGAAAVNDVPIFEYANLTSAFIGLTGNQGTLPRYYTEQLLEREVLHRDHAARAFLDLFSNRATAQFYQAWLKYRLHFQYEENRRERFLPMLLSLVGLGGTSMHGRLREDEYGVLDESLAYFAGVLRAGNKSATTIERLLAEYFQVPVRLTQFIGRWFEVPAEQCTALGSVNAALGQGALCGSRVWQRENRARLELGPLGRDDFNELLPRGRAARSLAKLLAMLTGSQIEYEIRLVLRKEDVRPAGLTEQQPTRLGFDGWLLTTPPQADLADAGYEIEPLLQ